MSPTSVPRRRTVQDLSPEEMRTLARLDRNVCATVPPSRPRGSSPGAVSMTAYEIYERYRALHWRAKDERAAWLQANRISQAVAKQAAAARYKSLPVGGTVAAPVE